MNHLTKVYLREEDKIIFVPISQNKPDISNKIQQKWQKTLDTIALILNVPSSLIMKIQDKEIKVFLKGDVEGNPYNAGDQDSLGHGLYCETVVGRDESLLIANALNNEKWKTNPDVKLNMISYLGYPLKWPDGEFFGTICVLDNKENHFARQYRDLMGIFKEIIEFDLSREFELNEIKNKNILIEQKIREVHHRIRNNFNMILSYIQIKANDEYFDIEKLIPQITSRIKAVSLLHEKLYKSADLQNSASEYIEEISKLLLDNLSIKNISLEIDVDNIRVFDNLLDLGMVVIELITNSIKYAFENTELPMIKIYLKRKKGRILFKYQDNGCGFSPQSSNGLGAFIIEGFAQNYKAKMKKYFYHGTVYEFHIDL